MVVARAARHPGWVDGRKIADGGTVEDGAAAVALVQAVLDPVLAAYGFAAGQGSWGDGRMVATRENPRPYDGMVIYCRPVFDGSPGCNDVVVSLRAVPAWHVQTVRDDDPREHWAIDYDDDFALPDRLAEVVAEIRARVRAPGPALPDPGA